MEQAVPSIYYLGDSHVRYFRKAAQFGLFSPYEVSGVEVGGATAVGMRNPNAKTNAIGRFRTWIADKSRNSIIIMHLGEVDCGFVIWYRASKYGEPVENQLRQSIDAYFEFVDELIADGFQNIIVTGATLPTITDDDQVGEVVLKRSAIEATQSERTELTHVYNSRLKDSADQRGLVYTDISRDVIDPNTGLVDTSFRNGNSEDHHMDVNLAAIHWAFRLNSSIDRYNARVLQEASWICTRETYLKAFPGHSKSMSADMRQRVHVGQTVSAQRVGDFGQFVVLRSPEVAGVRYPMLTLMHRSHFACDGKVI